MTFTNKISKSATQTGLKANVVLNVSGGDQIIMCSFPFLCGCRPAKNFLMC